MAKGYLSNRQKDLKIGITSYTESNTVLEVTGKVGIATTNATQELHVEGNLRVTGAFYDSSNDAGTNGYILKSTTTGTDWVDPTTLTVDIVGIATYANTAGVSTNVIGGIASVTQLSVSGVSTLGVVTAGNIFSTGIVTALTFVGDLTGTATTATNLADAANITTGTIDSARLTGTYNIDISGNAATATYASTAGIATYANTAGVSTNVIGGIASVTQLSVSGVSTFTGIGTFVSDLYVGGNVNIVGVLTAERLYSNIYGEFTGGGITGDSIVGTALSISGISTLGTVQISSGIVTASTGIVTYYGDGSNLTGVTAVSEDSYLFNIGITSSFSAVLTGIGGTIITFPSTAGKQYIVHSIHAANVAAGNTEVNVTGAFDFNGGERSYFAYSLPIPTGTGLELLVQPQIMNPSDQIAMRGLDYNRNGADNVVEVYVTYQEKTSTEYIGVGLGTVGLGITDPIGIYTSSTYPSVIQSIRLTNRTDTGAYPISISIASGVSTIRLVNNLIVPKYGSVELLETPKRLSVNDTINVQVDQAETIDVQVSGQQIV